jgi:hypothetical protein
MSTVATRCGLSLGSLSLTAAVMRPTSHLLRPGRDRRAVVGAALVRLRLGRLLDADGLPVAEHADGDALLDDLAEQAVVADPHAVPGRVGAGGRLALEHPPRGAVAGGALEAEDVVGQGAARGRAVR